MNSRVHLQIAALLVIVLTNVVALGGALWNRSGEAESQLQLSQRELRLPYRSLDRESSGLALALVWRVAAVGQPRDMHWSYAGGGPPEWLDKAKMESLGFDMAEPSGGIRWGERTLSRAVLLVLELDGEAYRRALERAREHFAAEEARIGAMPESKEKQNRLKNTAAQLQREEQESSRLFVIDAGLDASALRKRYPDRARYAIVHGQIRPAGSDRAGERVARGQVSDVRIAGINVPHALRPLLANAAGTQKFTASVVFGQRLEPWIAQLDVTTR